MELKIESRAGRYTFVWRRSVEKYREKLRIKIIDYYCLSKDTDISKITKFIISAFIDIREKYKQKGIEFVKGQANRKTEEQKECDLLKDWIKRLERDEDHIKTMGERNSYSRTDKDNAFIRMKDGHMRNGQLKPAYNVEMATTGNFIIGIYESHHPSDMYTAIVF